MKNINQVSGIPENEGFMAKVKRKATTALNWGKTHWKGLALGALAVGGGAYMLTRNKGDDEDEARPVEYIPATGDREAIREAIDRCFDSGTDDAGDGATDDEDYDPE